MTTDDSLPTSGLIDGRYRILECVGQGGMARVYRAEDTLLGRIVAIKLLRSELEGDDASAGRARGETTALASLNHPGLVTLYDAQLQPGRAEYLVMEFVDGPTLADRIAQGPLAPADVAALTIDLAEALHVVHSAGIVHRDIKPSNVLLSDAPFPTSRSGAKLADFGIAALVDAARLTSPGIVIGTAAYIAPEQLQGAMPAPPADIYALGLVMLEALTGARAFPQLEGIGAAMARLTSPPEVPAEFGPAWSGLLTAMTATDPGERPTASEVFAAASDLSAASAPPPLPTTPAAVAAAALAAGAAQAATAADAAVPPATAAMAPPSDAVTEAMAAPTAGAVGAAGAAGAAGAGIAAAEATRVMPAAPDDGGAERRPRRRRLGVIGAVAAAVAAASIAVGAWMTGGAAPVPAQTTPADTGGTAPATPPAPTNTPDAEQPAGPARGDDSKDDRKAEEKAEEKAAKEAEKEAEEQSKAAEKAAEEQRKAAEKAQKEAEKAAEDAEEEQQESEPAPTPDVGTGGATEEGTDASPSPAPTG
ncbi:serine/threonine-protein kinase [Microbacterium sp. OR21]|uniref:serine/threonine-protein kinase n=1 Tax=Microbacterium sp. OR21 TaxID=3095346 RepID=UPI0039B5ED5E